MFISACLFSSVIHLLVLTSVFPLHIENFQNSDSHKPSLLLSNCHSFRELSGFFYLLQIEIAALFIHSCNSLLLTILLLQSNLYKMTNIATTQKQPSWTGGCLIKHLYKTTTNQIWSFLAGF